MTSTEFRPDSPFVIIWRRMTLFARLSISTRNSPWAKSRLSAGIELSPEIIVSFCRISVGANPQGASRVYHNFYPSMIQFGTLSFEDQCPMEGDYDLNDLVVDYRIQLLTNAQNNVVDIKPQFYVRAAGAGFHNGFGFQVNSLILC